MASTVLYPPIVDGYIPAICIQQKIFVPFTFSKFNAAAADELIAGNTSEDFDPLTVQATICEVVSGQSAVNTAYVYDSSEFDEGYAEQGAVYAATGTILNLTPVKIKEDLYQIQIPISLISSPTVGKKYKIQLRFSGKKYVEVVSGVTTKQADWISQNAGYFSEWSTICILKYTNVPQLQFKSILGTTIDGLQNGAKYDTTVTYNTENLLVYGNYNNGDKGEYLTSFRIKLYKNYDSTYGTLSNLYDDSGIIEINSTINTNTFNYEFKKELIDTETYYALFSYETSNYFSDSLIIEIVADLSTDICDLEIDTIDYNSSGTLQTYTSLGEENEEGRVALFCKKISQSSLESGSYYRIKRYSSKDNFGVAEIIKTFTLPTNPEGNIIGPFYDTTIESGVLYKYGIQKGINNLDKIYTKTKISQHSEIEGTTINMVDNIINRVFEFSYLVGYNKKKNTIPQLKLKFNQTLNNFAITVNDAQSSTLGGKYAFITRNGDTRYRQFPVTGLISFNMDENKLFMDTEEIIKGNNEIENYYTSQREKYGNGYNEVYLERMFREAVLDFVYEDRARLYKSPTEGNIIIRITNISCTPEQSLNRLIYSFSGTGYEIADNTIENCEKYKVFKVEEKVISDTMIH